MAFADYFALAALFSFDGSNGATTFADYSVFNQSFVAAGAAALSNGQSKFGTTALYLDGSASGSFIKRTDALGVNSGIPKVFCMDAGDWTFECWVRADDFTSQRSIMGLTTVANTTSGPALFFNTSGQLRFTNGAGSTVSITGATTASATTWHHVAISRSGGVYRLFLNGVQEGSSATSSINDTAYEVYIGTISSSTGANATNKFKGYISDVRLYRSGGLYSGAFTPPGVLDVGTLSISGFAPTVTIKPVSGDVVVGVFGKYPDTQFKLFDLYFGGNGTVAGTIKIDGTPDYPAHRRVRLHREIDGMMVREQWSDATTGAYSFPHMDAAQKYTVISYDYTHTFRAVVADNITPE